MRIEVKNLTFSAIIGIYNIEKTAPQKLTVNLTVDYNYSNSYIDYIELLNFIKNDIIESKYEIIEDALQELNSKLLKQYKDYKINFIEISISKRNVTTECTIVVSNLFSSSCCDIMNSWEHF